MTKVVSPFWKSSYSGQENACVEVADTATHGRAVRDSKHPEDGAAPSSPSPVTAGRAFSRSSDTHMPVPLQSTPSPRKCDTSARSVTLSRPTPGAERQRAARG